MLFTLAQEYRQTYRKRRYRRVVFFSCFYALMMLRCMFIWWPCLLNIVLHISTHYSSYKPLYINTRRIIVLIRFLRCIGAIASVRWITLSPYRLRRISLLLKKLCHKNGNNLANLNTSSRCLIGNGLLYCMRCASGEKNFLTKIPFVFVKYALKYLNINKKKDIPQPLDKIINIRLLLLQSALLLYIEYVSYDLCCYIPFERCY